MLEYQVEIEVAAKRVVPGKPVHQNRGGVRQEGPTLHGHLLIGAEHPVSVDLALWDTR